MTAEINPIATMNAAMAALINANENSALGDGPIAQAWYAVSNPVILE